MQVFQTTKKFDNFLEQLFSVELIREVRTTTLLKQARIYNHVQYVLGIFRFLQKI